MPMHLLTGLLGLNGLLKHKEYMKSEQVLLERGSVGKLVGENRGFIIGHCIHM